MRDCGSGCTYRKGCILERDTKPRFDVISPAWHSGNSNTASRFTFNPFSSSQSILQISIYSICILATRLPAVALLRGHARNVGSTWQVNENYYITLLKFRLIGIRDQFCLISLPPLLALRCQFSTPRHKQLAPL